MIKAKIDISKVFDEKIRLLEQTAEEAVRDKLIDVAQTATNISPVDTGAYVTSFSYNVGAGRPRGKSSKNKSRGQNPEAKRQEGFNNLVSDINKIPNLLDSPVIVLRNGSPHATAVEYKHGYAVFARVRNIHG
jgi:soluble cytochrome b562